MRQWFASCPGDRAVQAPGHIPRTIFLHIQEPTPAAAASVPKPPPPWRQALPKAPLPTPEVYKGNQKLRHNKGYHANRGGTQREYFDSKYSGFRNYQLDPHMKNKPVPKVAPYVLGRNPKWKCKSAASGSGQSASGVFDA